MTQEKKSTTRTRRSVSLRTDPLDQVTGPDGSAGKAPAAPAQSPAAAKATTAKTAKSRDAEVDVASLGPLPGERIPGEETFKLTVNIPLSLHQRASGVVRYAEYSGEPEEVTTLTDLVRYALARQIGEYEQRFNKGEPFPAPKRLRRGRPASY